MIGGTRGGGGPDPRLTENLMSHPCGLEGVHSEYQRQPERGGPESEG